MFIATLTVLALLGSNPARANFLSYIDENGTKHIVQSEDEIPAKYRKDAKVTSAGDPSNSFFHADDSYVPNPKDTPRASCEKRAVWNFEQIKKKLFKKEDSMGPQEMRDYQALLDKREAEKAACKALPDTLAKKEAPKEEPKKNTDGK